MSQTATQASRSIRAPTTSTVADILIPVPGIAPETVGSTVFQLMTENKTWPGIGVVDPSGAAVGMLSRHAFLGIMAKPLMGDLYSKRPIAAIMRTDPLVVDLGASIEACVEALSARDPETLLEGFLIADGGRYVGAASAQDLLACSAALAHRAAEESRIKSERIAALLDHAHDGFLSIGRDLAVEPEYSRACVQMLGDAIAGRDVTELLFAADVANAELACKGLANLFEESVPARRAMYAGLLPKRVARDAHVIDITYAPMTDDRLMLVLKDMTDEVKLEETVLRERKRLEIVVHAAADSRAFFDAIAELREFLRAIEAIARPETSTLLDGEPLYRAIHTFKGTFGQYGFFELPAALHALEAEIGRAQSDGGDDLKAERNRLFDAISHARLGYHLNRELRVLAELFGDGFIEGEGMAQISMKSANQLQRLARTILRDGRLGELGQDERAALQEVAELSKVPLRAVLEGFEPVVAMVADRSGKLVGPLVITGVDVRVDREAHGGLIRALGHLFRNAVAHGIEPPEQREAAGKSELGGIRCTVACRDGQVELAIADNGRGLDEAALRAKATEILGADAAASLAGPALWDTVFLDGMSTARAVDEFSGRGVGMSAVRAVLTQLGGSIEIATTAGEGTCFRLRFPLEP